eukprot:40658_1
MAEISGVQPKFDVTIAIDFGTDGLGVAYALPNSNQIHVHDKWKTKKYGSIVKPKTILLFDDNFNLVNVGMDAKLVYIDLPNQRDEWMLFERFKMSLFEQHPEKNIQELNSNDDMKQSTAITDRKIGIKDTLTAANGKTVSSEKVFVAVFKHIQELCKKYLTKKIQIKNMYNNIQWIITVPAIWNDEAKNKMKQWAIKAGLVNEELNNNCRIVYESDCASLAIQYHMKDSSSVLYDVVKQKKRKKNEEKYDDCIDKGSESQMNNDYKLETGDKYILIDAGGGTVDIACHEIIGEFGVNEIYHPSGGKWGSIYIDDEFAKLLNTIFSTEWMS